MNPLDQPRLVARASAAFAVFGALLALKLLVGTMMLAALPGAFAEIAMMTGAVMLVIDVIMVVLWLSLRRGSNVARWIACVFIALSTAGNIGDVLTFMRVSDRVSMTSAPAFNGISGALMALVAAVALLVLVSAETRAAYAAPQPR